MKLSFTVPRVLLSGAVATTLIVTGLAAPARAAERPAAVSARVAVADTVQHQQVCEGDVCVEVAVQPPTGKATAQANKRALNRTLPNAYPFYTLQLNLCNSGIAPCYQAVNRGRSVGEAYGVITANFPDVVTLNEVCKADVTRLFPTMAVNYPYSYTFWSFVPAIDRDTNAPYRCANGDEYGVGVLGQVFAEDWLGLEAFGNVYPTSIQDADQSDEMRAWLCAAPVSNYYACTTHLTNKRAATAMSQCHYLMDAVVPAVRAEVGINSPVVVAGDFNLKYNGSPNMQACVPAGYFRKGDGNVQHFMASNHLTFDFTRSIPLQYTDHDGWLVSTITP